MPYGRWRRGPHNNLYGLRQGGSPSATLKRMVGKILVLSVSACHFVLDRLAAGTALICGRVCEARASSKSGLCPKYVRDHRLTNDNFHSGRTYLTRIAPDGRSLHLWMGTERIGGFDGFNFRLVVSVFRVLPGGECHPWSGLRVSRYMRQVCRNLLGCGRVLCYRGRKTVEPGIHSCGNDAHKVSLSTLARRRRGFVCLQI